MKKYVIFLFLFALGTTLLAQDDSTEDVLSTSLSADTELQKEKNELQFETHFIEALKQKSIENYDKAIAELLLAEKLFPNNVAMLFEMAKNHYKLKQNIEAHYFIDKALAIEPENYWLLSLSHDIFFKQHNYDEAIRVRKKMYTLKKDAAGGLLKLYYITKNKEEGQKLITEIDKSSIYVEGLDFYKRKLIGKIKPKQEEIKTKEEPYNKLIESLESKLQEKNYKSLFTESDTAISLYPAQSLVYFYNGMALSGQGKHKDAIVILEMGLDFVFEKPAISKRFYSALITAYTSIGNTNKVRYYEKLLGK